MKQVFVITGTRKGLGKGLALHYLSKGFIVIGCSRRKSNIDNSNYYHYELDVADESSVINMVSDVKNKFGKINVLLNNAGMASMNHIMTTPYVTVKNIFSTNYFGSFIFIREASKVMAKNGGGRIVNFTTVAVPLKLGGEAAYASSKAAVETLTQIAAKELADFNIRVNGIGPAPISTSLIKNVPKEKIEDLLNSQMIKRMGDLTDVINLVDFFVKKESDFITGQIIYLGGVSR